MSSLEVRAAGKRCPLEVRASDEAPLRVGGFALKFDRLSQNLGGFVEKIDRGFIAASEAAGWPGVMARYNHDDNFLLGTTAAGTLRLVPDVEGLLYEVDLPSFRSDVFEMVQRGDVSKSSFAFRVLEDDWSLTEDGFPLRTLLAGDLVDVAPVNTPAYLDTSTGLRGLAQRFDADPAEVRALADANDLARLFRRSDAPSISPQEMHSLRMHKLGARP